MNGIMDAGLADRGDGGACGMPRIPTGRFPAYSTSRVVTFDANGEAVVEFQAERDTLFTTLSTPPGVDYFLDASYCNTKYLVHSSSRVWAQCCERKPVFLVGVRDNKVLRIKLSGGTPDEQTIITLSGFQGNGCCG